MKTIINVDDVSFSYGAQTEQALKHISLGVNKGDFIGIIGPSGAGKTRNVLKPNLLQMNASYIVLDTKGTLCREIGPVLAAHGYRVQHLNFADLDDTAPLPEGIEQCGYNPLNHIRRSKDG